MKYLVVILAAWLAVTILPSVLAAPSPVPEDIAKPGPAIGTEPGTRPTEDVTKPGTYTAGKWTYTLEFKSMGHKTESRTGTLLYEGRKLDVDPRVNDFVRTPWGIFYWVGKHWVTWEDSGWMPKPKEDSDRSGRELAVSGVSMEELAQLPAPAGTDEIILDKEAAGHFVEAVVGQGITVRLPGNTSTGFSWEALPPDDPAVIAAGKGEYAQESATPPMLGQGGMFVFRFLAQRPGAAKLVFKYKRQWEKDPTEVFTVLVRVADGNRK